MTWRGRGRPPQYKLPQFINSFQEKYFLPETKNRTRKFTPENVFLTLLHLCSGKNKEGYLHALFQTFDVNIAPVKSSLSKVRKKISSLFFADLLKQLLDSIRRPTWRGLYIYACDGFEAAIPRTESILKAGYKGRRLESRGKVGETYYPHLYLVHTYDVLSRTTKALSFGPDLHEIKGALEQIPKLETQSLTIYDRLYATQKIINAHFANRSFFLIRCRQGGGVPKEIKDFFANNKRTDSFFLNNDNSKKIYLYKIKHPKQKEIIVLMTNKENLGRDAVRDLYRMRWEVENSFRDLTESLKIEQWHSKDINGIEQEIYVRFWMMNFSRIQQFQIEKAAKNPFSKFYKRSNFKLILDFISSNWQKFLDGNKNILQKLKEIISRSTERRKRYSLSKPRQIRFNPSNYKAANVVFDRKEKMEKSP